MSMPWAERAREVGDEVLRVSPPYRVLEEYFCNGIALVAGYADDDDEFGHGRGGG